MKKHGIFNKNSYIDQWKIQFFLGKSNLCEIYRVCNDAGELKTLKLITPEFIPFIDIKSLSDSLERYEKITDSSLLSNSQLL